MRYATTTVTSKGQVTIPAHIRQVLGIQPRDRVEFVVRDGSVYLSRVPTSVREVRGMIKAKGPLANIDDMIRDAKDERAERLAEKMRKN
jgi:AbrB family looped-hinge helix DNA binding protein